MKTKVKALVAILLTLVMAATLILPSAAATASNHKQYKLYVSLGDSVPVGYGPNNTTVRGFKRVAFAYPALLADTLHVDMVPLARTGFRVQEIRAMLDVDYTGDEYLFKFGKEITPELITKYKPIFKREVQNADLITLQVGMNDLFNMARLYATNVIIKHKGDDANVTQAIHTIELEDDGTGAGSLLSILQLAEDLGMYAEAAAAAMEGLLVGYKGFVDNWDALIQRIYALNKDVDLYVVGAYNPLKKIKLTSSDPVAIGELGGLIAHLLNATMKASKYNGQYTFVDAYNVETYDIPALTDDTFQDQYNTRVHPTTEGHKYIMYQILNAIPEQ